MLVMVIDSCCFYCKGFPVGSLRPFKSDSMIFGYSQSETLKVLALFFNTSPCLVISKELLVLWILLFDFLKQLIK